MHLDWNIALLLVVTFQLFFISVFLLTIKNRKRAGNLVLGIFFLALAINIGDLLLQLTDRNHAFPLFFLLDDTLLLLFGPLVIWYVRYNMQKNFKIDLKQIIHLIPFLICLVGLFLVYSWGAPSYEEAQNAVTQGSSKAVFWVSIIFYTHPLVYFWWSKSMLNRHKNALRENYSNAVKVDLKWLDFILNSIGVIWILGMVHSIIPFSSLGEYLHISLLLFTIVLFVFINRVLFKALKKPQLFLQPLEPMTKKYAGSNLGEVLSKSLAKNLAQKMELEKLYKNPDLTISDLANLMDLSTKEVSQIINQTFGQHFFDYVNSYRIDAAKELLARKDHQMTIQEIMYEVGFSSKSSFNTVFRKKTGVTPTEFKRGQKEAKW
ncbi:helix-turn-helix domain-containing protein [Flagellimonas meishanensis]|uniref:helix-turn-helix domain-containing protein n=1 Tax=Flagellimonas meishanensis TaxID=2873264 RepID=UPI001CA78006|nr:AraC family transcriptional regulator [[Muricauda] meishanensis]